jgi:hypothetical protein
MVSPPPDAATRHCCPSPTAPPCRLLAPHSTSLASLQLTKFETKSNRCARGALIGGARQSTLASSSALWCRAIGGLDSCSCGVARRREGQWRTQEGGPCSRLLLAGGGSRTQLPRTATGVVFRQQWDQVSDGGNSSDAAQGPALLHHPARPAHHCAAIATLPAG